MKKLFLLILIFIFNLINASEAYDRESVIINEKEHLLIFNKLSICIGLNLSICTEVNLYLNEVLIGTLMFDEEEKGKDKYNFFYLYIDGNCRKSGYGKFLIAHLRHKLIQKGAKEIYLSPMPFDKIDGVDFFTFGEQQKQKEDELCKFYERCGFEKVGDIYMAKNLKEN